MILLLMNVHDMQTNEMTTINIWQCGFFYRWTKDILLIEFQTKVDFMESSCYMSEYACFYNNENMCDEHVRFNRLCDNSVSLQVYDR